MAQPARIVEPATQAPTDDIVVFNNVTWADYQRFLEIRGERSVPRLTYLEGVLEVMSPSRPHGSITSMIGRLIETWCLEKDVDITPYGSWALESKEHERGVEPDECYVIGDVTDPDHCDLAIEVIWTSGGVDKLRVYEKLGVREVWIWRTQEIHLFSLKGGEYVRLDRSELLPDLDLTELLRFVDVKPMTRAVKEYRALLRG